MTFFQALAYFTREASVSLVRSWKVSLLAIGTIAVSLFVGGVFLLASGNLAAAVERWRQESRVIVYLVDGASEAELAALGREVAAAPWVTAVEAVSREQARQRFRAIFPSLSDLVEGWGEEEPLPASLEIGFDPARAAAPGFAAWLGELRRRPGVAMVDDDRDWLAQLGAVVTLVRGVGLGLAVVLLAAAIFIIGSVIRLTAYLYQDEIAVMRLVGATEFFIRGPFYVEGLLQGLLGGLAAAAALWGAHRAVAARAAESAWGALVTGSFLSPAEVASLALLGGAAGLAGAVASLRREKLGASE